MDDFESRPQALDWTTQAKIRALGDPYSLDPPDGGSRDPEALERELTFLAPGTAAPFFAAVLVERDIPVEFPEDSQSKDDKMGVAGNRRNKRPTQPRPFIPLIPYFEEYCEKLVDKNQPGPQRLDWVRRTFPAPTDHEKRFLEPPRVPAEAWSHMQSDMGTWTNPEKSAPAGVEGGSGAATSSKRRKVQPWNQHRDRELSGLESLARDGMRLANASFLVFSQLMNGLLDDESQMSRTNRLRSFYTLKDLQYCTGEHFCRLSSQLAHLRKLNAISALNLADEKPFRDVKMGPDLFGGKFKELHAADVALKKERLEKDRLKKAQQQSASAKSSKKQPFRRNDGDKGGGSHQSNQSAADSRQSKGGGSKDPPKKDNRGGSSRRGGGGGSGGGNYRGGGGRGRRQRRRQRRARIAVKKVN